MKNFIFLLWSCICCFSFSNAQKPEVLNKYNCVYLPQVYYDKGKTDIYGIRKTVADKLNTCSVPLFLEENEISNQAMKNPCTMLHCLVNNTSSSKGLGFSDIKILFLNCKNDTVLNCSAVAQLRSNLNDTRASFISTVQKALEIFKGQIVEVRA